MEKNTHVASNIHSNRLKLPVSTNNKTLWHYLHKN